MSVTFIRNMLLLVIFTSTGCTNYTYHGAIAAKDSSGVNTETYIVWSKTKPLIGKAKADMINLLTACGTPVIYNEKASGIIFFGVPNDDIPINKGLKRGNVVFCGQILGHKRVEDISAGKLELKILCRPKPGRFSGDKRRYLKARNKPYVFTVTESKKWSFLGKNVVLPKPACKL